ncbi:MAG: hypothetical protein G01um101430_207 [Parcubacteria group bacterium Gr01-1014_30]|nr:MAG: hypothetical protein G01um101430_207 [Parcubacteria group bacterium Gr01-1014_30]
MRLAFKLLFQPWRWKKKGAVGRLEEEFAKYLGVKYAFSFNSGRSALMVILDALGLKKNDEVLLQAFTCNAAANPIIWVGLKPVYVDCDESSFNIDVDDLKRTLRRFTPRGKKPKGRKAKVLIVQHTFGLPAEMQKIMKICRENNLILIEDCAHALGAKYKNRKVGTFGKVSFFSFSRDKVISSVYGGMVAVNDDDLAKKLKEYQGRIGEPSYCWIFQQLLHPLLMNWKILPTYRVFGKYILVIAQGLRILSKAVHWREKRGKKPAYFPKRLPSALATLALAQMKKIKRFNNHRRKIAEFYRKALKSTSFELPPKAQQIYLRFAVKHLKAHDIIKKAWKKNILLGDWYDSPIAPSDTQLDKLGYVGGSCKKAEKLAKQTLNLPTHINISIQDAEKVVKFLEPWK